MQKPRTRWASLQLSCEQRVHKIESNFVSLDAKIGHFRDFIGFIANLLAYSTQETKPNTAKANDTRTK